MIANVKMQKNRSFPVKFCCETAIKAEVLKDTQFWHKRFCHLNFHGLKLLKKKHGE